MPKLITRDMLDVLKDLPEVVCYGPTEAKKLGMDTGFAVHRGRPGYTPVPAMRDEYAERKNRENGVTAAQAEAMLTGSMFGWHVPGADPLNCKPVEG